MALDWQALEAKKAANWRSICRRSPAGGLNPKGKIFEKGKALELIMACIKRVMGLTTNGRQVVRQFWSSKHSDLHESRLKKATMVD